MHDRLTQLLDEEVVGEVTQVGDTFFDVGLGRLCLDRLDKARIDELLGKLREAFGHEIEIDDRLYLSDPGEIVRGLVEVSLQDPEMGALYVLQITSQNIVAFYERRFALVPGVVGDLMGTFCRGLAAVVDRGEGPLRVLSGYDALKDRYLGHLDGVVQSAVAGTKSEAGDCIADLVEDLRAAWELIPWPLKTKLKALSRGAQDRIARHDRVLQRTVIFAADPKGEVVYEYVHQNNPYEEYDQVLGWMTDIHKAVIETYCPPRYISAMARASSVEKFLGFFPGFREMIGEPIADGLEP